MALFLSVLPSNAQSAPTDPLLGVETSSVQVTCCPAEIVDLTSTPEHPPTSEALSGISTESTSLKSNDDFSLSTPSSDGYDQQETSLSTTEGPVWSLTVCQGIESKFCRIVRAAEDADSGIDPYLIAAVGIHESGFAGPIGFGIIGGHGGYRTDGDVSAAVESFLALVSSPGRYERAWSHRDSSVDFLNGLVDAGYAGPEGRGWPPKILWLREFMIEHPRWKSD